MLSEIRTAGIGIVLFIRGFTTMSASTGLKLDPIGDAKSFLVKLIYKRKTYFVENKFYQCIVVIGMLVEIRFQSSFRMVFTNSKGILVNIDTTTSDSRFYPKGV